MKQLPDFNKARVLVVGDVMLDHYWHGDTNRISPEAPVPVVKVQGDTERAGGAGNVALNIAALGAQATVMGLAGKDHNAQKLQDILEQQDVACHLHRLEAKICWQITMSWCCLIMARVPFQPAN